MEETSSDEHEQPLVSVVVSTRDRPERLAALLASLRAQAAPPSFEVVVVDDASAGPTGELLARERERGDLGLRVVRRPRVGGPGRARNDGWRLARAGLVAFVDDDCVADPGWLAAGAQACAASPGAVVQGRTDPDPREVGRLGPFSHSQLIHAAGPRFQTCNIFYPRDLLQRLGGFDADTFPEGGEDTDLAWRAIESGAGVAYADTARVFHAVTPLGPLGTLRLMTRFAEAVQLYSRHPELRRVQLTHGVFWTGSHYLLVRALLALLLPRRLWPLRRWLALPYLLHLLRRGGEEGGSLVHAPYFLLYDLVELVTVVRGAIRHRTLVL